MDRAEPGAGQPAGLSAARRVEANLAALRTLAAITAERRPATPEEQRTLAAWTSWGAVPQVFDEARAEWQEVREQLRAHVGEDGYRAARRTTINAHYTDPAYARAVWSLLRELGFEGGRVLEPGCGAGVFAGLAPVGAELTGVELDPTTAAIAQALNPRATIRAESFAVSPFPDGHFDAVVGNVPFADVRLHDPRHNAGGHTIHNHFILKSLALTRPGGVVAVLSSRFTLDAQDDAARRELHALADLLGAVRLPTGAHRRWAGTEAVTDLLILRRREPGAEPASAAWLETRPRTIDGHEAWINAYFDAHPEHVLGTLAVGHGMHSAQTLHVRGDLATTARDLAAAAEGIAAAARREGRALTPRAAERAAEHAEDPRAAAVPVAQAGQLAQLLGLRDAAQELLAAEAATAEDTPEIGALRTELARRYERYVRHHGPINGYELRATGRVDPATGEPGYARVVPPAMRTFRADPSEALVRALENFDESTRTATPAKILSRRVIAPRAPVLHAETPADALAVAIEQHGRVDLDAIASLLGRDPAAARAALGELVYEDPASGRLVPAPEYLSGNVHEKLEVARAAAASRPGLAANVQALERVIPVDLGMDEVEARLGAAWIDAPTHQQFLAELLGDGSVRVENPSPGIWQVEGGGRSVRSTSEWGTPRMPAAEIMKTVLEQRAILIQDRIGDGKYATNPVDTAAAQEKATALQERFAEWVWEEPQRAARLLATYNRRFNALVLRDYRAEGERLTLPGLASTFTPREHQRTAVARMLSEPAVGLFHQVGAGKTAEMVMGTMELKRLGMVSKPAVVVPNHMLEQFSREWLQLYPQARVLAASSEDLKGDRRRLFVARVATNDWDAVIMTRTAFEKLPMSREVQEAYVAREVEALRAARDHAAAHGSTNLTIKRMEKIVLAAEQRLEKKLAGIKDPGIGFEQTGIDYLVVDELHDYKNLRTPSNVGDAAIDGSDRATDLHMKVGYLRERHGERVITAATATPIANSVTEAHVMLRYLRPDLLEQAGVDVFDVWAATFGQTVTELEMAPTGGGHRIKTRFARFQNVPEMLRMWHVCADVKTAEDLQLDVPELAAREDGERRARAVVVEQSPELAVYMQELAKRAQASGPRSRAVMLTVTNDGRKSALDMRMVAGEPASIEGKLDAAARQVAGIWREHRDRVYADPATEQLSPTRGALQIVFCDLGVPGAEWSAYEELRDLLVARGVPRAQVRFIHEAKGDEDRARLFKAARSGEVAVLVGSTQKMGVGTNIQARAVALHHLDCPWRPADVEQREGRILRQGNQNAEVTIHRYVVEGSFDAYLWQTVERKARFINQLMRGRLDVREVEDVGDSALSFAEVKALAAGDPLLLDKAHADYEVTRLDRLSRAYARNQQALTRANADAERRIAAADAALPHVHAAIGRLRETRGDAFAMTVGGRRTDERAVAADRVRAWAVERLSRISGGRHERPLGELGELGGLAIDASYAPPELAGEPSFVMSVRGVPAAAVAVPLDQLQESGIGIVRRLENRLADLPSLAQRLEASRTASAGELAAGRAALARPFKHAEALDAARARAMEVDAELARRERERREPEREPERDGAVEVEVAVEAEAEAEAVVALAAAADDMSFGM